MAPSTSSRFSVYITHTHTHIYRRTRENELKDVEREVGKIYMKLSSSMSEEATRPEMMKSGTLQTRGAFPGDRNSWRLSMVNVTNKYLELYNMDKTEGGQRRKHRFKFPQRTLKEKVRMPLVWCDTAGSCFYFVSRVGRVVEFCASNRSECLEWYSIIRETINMCVPSSSVKSLLITGGRNKSSRRLFDRHPSDGDDDDNNKGTDNNGANLITVSCIQNSLLRVPKCAKIEQAWYGNQTTQLNGRFVTDQVRKLKTRFFQDKDQKGDFVIFANSKLLGDTSRDATKKLVVTYRMPKGIQVDNPQDQISRIEVKIGDTTPMLKYDTYLFRARFGTEHEYVDVTSRVRHILNKTSRFEVQANALGVSPSSRVFRTLVLFFFGGGGVVEFSLSRCWLLSHTHTLVSHTYIHTPRRHVHRENKMCPHT